MTSNKDEKLKRLDSFELKSVSAKYAKQAIIQLLELNGAYDTTRAEVIFRQLKPK